MAISNQGIKKPAYDQFSVAGVLPAGVAGTGQFTVSGVRVTGIATAFDTEINNGDYLYSSTLNEARRVKHVMNPELIILSEAFSGGVPMDTPQIIRKQDISNQLQIGILNEGALDATVDESVLPAGTAANFSDSGGIGPITFDGSVSILGITQKLRG
jgi:hypothetical protein